ncbi:hypothetical protein HDF13_001647 [Edaphobacter lichenicola]|uniref:Uncharacterized protein n=1 Tax=Tunturiibacter gelidiferens TaxID=3069689 RepID=A0ACC5NXM9_9BACT|nr:hypothetical protein [Edaphobacter lichenicola]
MNLSTSVAGQICYQEAVTAFLVPVMAWSDGTVEEMK